MYDKTNTTLLAFLPLVIVSSKSGEHDSLDHKSDLLYFLWFPWILRVYYNKGQQILKEKGRQYIF